MQPNPNNTEQQIQAKRDAFQTQRQLLEEEIANLFENPADAVDGLLTNADAYGTDAAISKLARGLDYVSPPAGHATKAPPETTARAKEHIDKLMDIHGELDLLNTKAQREKPTPGPQRIFIQAKPFTLSADGRLQAIPEPVVRPAPAPAPAKAQAKPIPPAYEDDEDEPEPSV